MLDLFKLGLALIGVGFVCIFAVVWIKHREARLEEEAEQNLRKVQ